MKCVRVVKITNILRSSNPSKTRTQCVRLKENYYFSFPLNYDKGSLRGCVFLQSKSFFVFCSKSVGIIFNNVGHNELLHFFLVNINTRKKLFYTRLLYMYFDLTI